MLENWYKKIYEAGYNARAVEEHESHSHNLEDMFERGKQIGRHDAFVEGYTEGYKKGYVEGEMDVRAEMGVISLDGLDKAMDEVKDEFKGFHGIVNERGYVDDVESALEEVQA